MLLDRLARFLIGPAAAAGRLPRNEEIAVAEARGRPPVWCTAALPYWHRWGPVRVTAKQHPANAAEPR